MLSLLPKMFQEDLQGLYSIYCILLVCTVPRVPACRRWSGGARAVAASGLYTVCPVGRQYMLKHMIGIYEGHTFCVNNYNVLSPAT